ncbi:CBO0543 family protein [Ectobacillus ponti]|uniref:PAS domain-containing protein n=1 Tax=Ectobacillus ponti TaxID=2961894 RepID=A0AA42BPJ7_9BACI|nr:PAS domain-containing protein [Ectobacillus ponti]MCP8969190.1 PAS domain-containing protein [Ectobacillus ponti]
MIFALQEGYDTAEQGYRVLTEYWQQGMLQTWEWYTALLLSAVPWLLWLRWHDKAYFSQYMVSGIVAALFAVCLDTIGLAHGLWRYHVQVIPATAGLLPWNLTLIPVCFMLSYQVLPHVSIWGKAAAAALLCGLVGEPIVDAAGLVDHIRWRHTLSVPFYFLIYITAYFSGRTLVRDHSMRTARQREFYMQKYEHSAYACSIIRKEHLSTKFYFQYVNEAFCREFGYDRQEIHTVNPLTVSELSEAQLRDKYSALLKKQEMCADSVYVTGDGRRKPVRVCVNLLHHADAIEIISVAEVSSPSSSSPQTRKRSAWCKYREVWKGI